MNSELKVLNHCGIIQIKAHFKMCKKYFKKSFFSIGTIFNKLFFIHGFNTGWI